MLCTLQANEVGDLIAGAFAPLAFVWLATAVLIQAQELRATREELALTREEYSMSRGVMEEQALEARRQAEFIGTQTSILTEEQEQRREALADDAFKFRYEQLQNALNDARHVAMSTENLSRHLLFPRTGAGFQRLSRTLWAVTNDIQNGAAILEEPEDSYLSVSNAALHAMELFEPTSPRMKDRMGHEGFEEFVLTSQAFTDAVLDRLIQQSKETY